MQKTLLMIVIFFTLSIASEHIGSQSQVAVDGYDVVAYFRNNWPCHGKIEYTYSYMGKVWYFANLKNLEIFKETPEKFIPMFNGFNSAKISKGKLDSANPLYFLIKENRLFLFSNKNEVNQWKIDFAKEQKQAELKWSEYILAKN